MLSNVGGVPFSVSGVQLEIVAIKFARPDSDILAVKFRQVTLQEWALVAVNSSPVFAPCLA